VHYKFDESSGTNANDETANNLDGTHTNSPSITTGKTGNGISYPNGATEVYTAVPYGSGLNPSTSSLSVCLGVLPHNASAAQKIWFSTDNGTSQRFYIGQIGGTIGIGIQGSGFTTGSEFPVVAEWTRVCLVANSGTDTATLYVNGVKGTSAQVVKTYTSYTFASNFKVGVGTFDVNYGGSTADDLKIYAATALSDQEVLDDFTAWSATTPAPTGTFEQKTHQWRKLRKTGAGAIESYGAVGATVPVMVGGAVILDVQVDCTTADCSALSLRLHGNLNSGAFTAVPDAFGAKHHKFYGVTADPDILSGSASCCLTGALTENDGATQFTSSAIPSFDLAQDASIVQRYVLSIGSGATAGDTMCFKVYSQDGNAMDSYSPSAGACLAVVSPIVGVGN
jgi:hypothetical protein